MELGHTSSSLHSSSDAQKALLVSSSRSPQYDFTHTSVAATVRSTCEYLPYLFEIYRSVREVLPLDQIVTLAIFVNGSREESYSLTRNCANECLQ